MKLFSEICNRVSELSWNNRNYKKFNIHKEFYHQLRAEFPKAGSQLIIVAIANVAGDMSREKKQHKYRELGALKLDKRLYSILGKEVSIYTINKRVKVKMFLTKFLIKMIYSKARSAEVLLDKSTKQLYLSVAIKTNPTEEKAVKRFLGVDKGIVNIATLSDGQNFSGKIVDRKRKKYRVHKAKLQKCGSKSAKRRLSKTRQRESRFKKDLNHCISKKIVKSAEGTGSAIVLENLKGITKSVTVSKAQRARFKGWSFHQLDSFIQYKARRKGVKVIMIEPQYTSQQCPCCDSISESNRKVRDTFKCLSCGFTEDADFVASINIANRGAIKSGFKPVRLDVNHPIVGTVKASA